MFLQAFAALTFQNAERKLVAEKFPVFHRFQWSCLPSCAEWCPFGTRVPSCTAATQRHWKPCRMVQCPSGVSTLRRGARTCGHLATATNMGGNIRKTDWWIGKALRFYTHTNLTHPEIDSVQPFLLGCFWTYVFCWWVWVWVLFTLIKLLCSFCNLTGQSQGFFQTCWPPRFGR